MVKQAMILAAGRGERLRPLTDKTPKPLLAVKGVPIIDHVLCVVKKAGIEKVTINLHHLGDQIKKYVGDGRRYGLKVSYTNEVKILGTGGGIKNAQKFLKGGPFVVINADVLIDIDLKKVIARHKKCGCTATMVIRRIKRGEDYARLSIARDGRLKAFGRGDYMFTGVQILEPVIFKYLKKPSCLIKDGYKQILANKLPICTFIHKGYWNDIGTHERYQIVRYNSWELSSPR